MSMRSKGNQNGDTIHTLNDNYYDDVVVTVTKAKDPESGAVDVVVEKDKYVDGKIDSLVVDKKHVESKGGHVETTHVEAGHGGLEIDKTVKDVTKGHVVVTETVTEVKDNRVVEIDKTIMDGTKGHVSVKETVTEVKGDTVVEFVTETDMNIKGGMVDTGSGGYVKEMTIRKRRDSSSSSSCSSCSSCCSCPSCTSCSSGCGPICGSSDDDKPNKACTCVSRAVHRVQKRCTAFVHKYSHFLGLAFRIFLLLGFYAFFIYAMIYKFGDEGSIRLLCIALLITFYVLYRVARIAVKKRWTCCCWLVSCFKFLKWVEEGFWRIAKFMKLKIILCVLMTLFFLVYCIVVIGLNQPKNLISASGMVIFVIIFFVFSDNPEKVRWRPVFCGLSMQFVFAMMLMRTKSGAAIFTYLGERILEFMSYANAGARFVFGPNYADHFFAFKVMPVIILFSSVITVLYHLGVMQFFIKHLGRLLTLLMDTSPVENVVAIANIFVGQIEAPLLAGPYLQTMTRSQLHTVMTSGFATVAGPIMAAFALYDVPVIHLLAASVMSAPAAIAMSKLFYPESETEVDICKDENYIYKIKGRATNIIEAASNGAIDSIKIICNILAHLIAFVSIMMFFNASFKFLGYRVGLIPPDYPELTFQLVYSYLFWPMTVVMGVDIPDCRRVAEMIGTKMVINEFAAYSELSTYINNKNDLMAYLGDRNLTMATGYMTEWYNSGSDIILNDTQQVLLGGIISDRSTVITTYALCGFSNFSAMGIILGALTAIIPQRKSDLARVVFRAMIAGNFATFMTACIAGLLYKESPYAYYHAY